MNEALFFELYLVTNIRYLSVIYISPLKNIR